MTDRARLLRRYAPAVLPWSFGAFVFLTSMIDMSGGTAARDFAGWLGAVSNCSPCMQQHDSAQNGALVHLSGSPI